MERQLKWIPENNEEFYYIGRKLCVEWDKYSVGNKEYIESGNCFKTKDEAQVVLDMILPAFEMNFREDEGLILLESDDSV